MGSDICGLPRSNHASKRASYREAARGLKRLVLWRWLTPSSLKLGSEQRRIEIKVGSVSKKKAACFFRRPSEQLKRSQLVVHVTHAAHSARAMRHRRSFRLWLFGHHGLGGNEESGNGGSALQR